MVEPIIVPTSPRRTAEASPVKDTGCCPPFEPAPWQDQEVTWTNKLFVKDRVFSVLHVPLGMDQHMTKDMALIEAAQAKASVPLMLADSSSAWHTDLYIDVSAPVPGATMTTMSGRFFTHVFEGPFSKTGEWVAQLKALVAQRGEVLEHLYFAYTTCPNCAKAYGKNYVIGFAKLAPRAAA